MMNNVKRLKAACYGTNVSMAVVSCLSPLLFLTFRNLYGISYSLLGTLVLVNFFTQLTVDLIFSFFSYKINIQKAVKFTPFLAVVGLIIYGAWPFFSDNVYLGLLIGTVIFSASSGFAEVLISPVIAAIPSDDPDKEMSKLHSVFAWGSVAVVLLSTLFIKLIGQQYWQYLAFILAAIPLFASVMFFGAEIPEMEKPEKLSGVLGCMKNKTLWLCVIAIFLGGASECTMGQWSSGYLEMALGIPKLWGDIFGVALFSLALAIGRTLYSNIGKNIEKVLFLGATGAFICYTVAAICPVPVIGLICCAFTGFCVSMLWPGTLIVSAKRIPAGGVFVYAMLAAGGDFGASVGPQLIGVITDTVAANPWFITLAQSLGLGADQLGMKLGLVSGAMFPLLAIIVFGYIKKTTGKEEKCNI